MNKMKYSEQDYLCSYDLSLEFFKEIGICVNDVVPLRKVFIISTDEGKKILKRVDYDIDRIDLITDSLNYVKRKYPNVISYNDLDGKNYKVWNDKIYVIMDILEGREVSYSNPVEIKLCAQNVALMHNASLGLREHLKKTLGKDFLDVSLRKKYNDAYNELLEMKEIVRRYKYKNEFDNLFMINVEKYLEEIKKVQFMLERTEYSNIRNNNDLITLCHNDLAYHNFLIKDNKINILDFDFMTIDLRVVDIADFILKSIKNVAFDMEKMNMCIDEYEKIAPLKKQEKELLYVMLSFPKDFHAISRDYYFKRKKWDFSVYLNRFKNKLNNEIFRHQFLEEYKKHIFYN